MKLEVNVWRIAFVFSTILNMAFFGLFLNYLAVLGNGGKMPISLDYQTENHIHLEKEKINFYYFTDIFCYNKRFCFSIGDVIIFSATFCAIMVNCILTLIYFKEKWKRKRK